MKAIRIAAAVPGVAMLLSALGWLFQPEDAAKNLGMPLLDGVARSTQIGDFGAFFFATGTMCMLGAIQQQAQWLYGAAMLLV